MKKFKFLPTTDPWEIIIRDQETNEIYSLKQQHTHFCEVCQYPFYSKKKECHKGLNRDLSEISFISGHFYETDYNGIPNNWFGKLLKNISEQPFKYSHTILTAILKEKIQKTNWNIKRIDFATMVPTTNQQMYQLFSKIAKDLEINWVPAEKLFNRKELNIQYTDRKKYVQSKYCLKKTRDIPSRLLNDKTVLIFDDIFNQGYTFSRIIDLLSTFSIKNFKLASIARTTPKIFRKSFSFP